MHYANYNYAKRDSGFGESLSIGSFNTYLGLSHEKKIKGDQQVFIENFTNKKLEEIFPKKNHKATHNYTPLISLELNTHNTHNIQSNHGIIKNTIDSKTCDNTPFTSYLGLNTRNTYNTINKNPIVTKSEINTSDSNIPIPSAAEISINRSLQLIREASAKLKTLKNSKLNQTNTKVISESVGKIRNLLRN